MYFGQISCVLSGLKVEAFREAWEAVIRRHTILRSEFIGRGRGPAVQVVRAHVKAEWVERDWRGRSEEEMRILVEEFLRVDRQRGFELSRAPLMRFGLCRLSEETYQWNWSHHHLLLDGWSVPLVMKEVLGYYKELAGGGKLEVSAARPYREYIQWLQKQDMKRAEAYWRERLQGFEVATELPGRKAGRSKGPGRTERRARRLSGSLSQALERWGKGHQVTLNTLVQGAWAVMLSRHSGQPEVVFGVTVSGRPAGLKGVERMVGLFINTLPVRVRVAAQEEVAGWLKVLQAGQVEMREYEYSPLVEVQGWSEVP